MHRRRNSQLPQALHGQVVHSRETPDPLAGGHLDNRNRNRLEAAPIASFAVKDVEAVVLHQALVRNLGGRCMAQVPTICLSLARVALERTGASHLCCPK